MEKIKELICYGVVGVCTTLVNYVVYYVCLRLNLHWLFSNSIAWFAAVIFAYITNRKVVFRSNKDVKKECVEFFGLRFVTLIVESLLLAICIDWLCISNMISKVIVSVITVLSNYWLCKIRVFHQEVCYE